MSSNRYKFNTLPKTDPPSFEALHSSPSLEAFISLSNIVSKIYGELQSGGNGYSSIQAYVGLSQSTQAEHPPSVPSSHQNKHLSRLQQALLRKLCNLERWSVISYFYFVTCHSEDRAEVLRIYFTDLFEKLIKSSNLVKKVFLAPELEANAGFHGFSREELWDMLEFNTNRVTLSLEKM